MRTTFQNGAGRRAFGISRAPDGGWLYLTPWEFMHLEQRMASFKKGDQEPVQTSANDWPDRPKLPFASEAEVKPE